MPNKWTEGETLFAQYLTEQGIPFEYEQLEPGKRKPVDFTIRHPDCGTVLLEVKDIQNEVPRGFSQVDFYKPIRSHIEAGTEKFKEYKGRVCVLVLYGGRGFVDLGRPEVMLGAMYGDFGWSIPFDPEAGQGDASKMSAQFIPGKGKMIRRDGLVRNTRISALVALHNYNVTYSLMKKYINEDDGRTERERRADVINRVVTFPEEQQVGVTIWENGLAVTPFPRDLFRGEMDEWWTLEGEYQTSTFVGSKLRSLGIVQP
jgi:hypothetical protein